MVNRQQFTINGTTTSNNSSNSNNNIIDDTSTMLPGATYSDICEQFTSFSSTSNKPMTSSSAARQQQIISVGGGDTSSTSSGIGGSCSSSNSSSINNNNNSRLSNIYVVKRQQSGDNKSDSDNSIGEGVSGNNGVGALKNDVRLTMHMTLSPNSLQQNQKGGVRNALISEMANFSPVHLSQVDHNGESFFFFIFLFIFCLSLYQNY